MKLQVLLQRTTPPSCDVTRATQARTLALRLSVLTTGYATWFTAGAAIRIAHYDVIDDVITRKL